METIKASDFLQNDELNYHVQEKSNDEDRRASSRMQRTIKAQESYEYIELITFSLMISIEVLNDEPSNVSSILDSNTKIQWLDSMKEEISSLSTITKLWFIDWGF